MNTNKSNGLFRILCLKTNTRLLLAAFLACLVGSALGQALPGILITAPDAVTFEGDIANTDNLGESRERCLFLGRTLAAWNALYECWAFGAITVPTDLNGNAVVPPGVVLMPLPDAPGDGTPGHLDVTLYKGQAFVLPLWVLLGTHYTDGTPADPRVPRSVFRTLHITFKIDGATVISRGNVMNFYSGFVFSPWIPVNFPPIDAIIWFEGISIVHGPLSPGMHTLKLDAINTQPAFGGFFEYHNTWRINVQRR